MRPAHVERMKTDIRTSLELYLSEETVRLYIAANDNGPLNSPHVAIEAIEEGPLEGSRLLSKIRVTLGVLGKPARCEALIAGIYEALQPHFVTQAELTVLLMSLHVEPLPSPLPRHSAKRAVMRYIVEETPSDAEAQTSEAAATASSELC